MGPAVWLFAVTCVVAALSSTPGWVPVHFDEAQYASWLIDPALSYQTKGPLVTFTQSLIEGLALPPLVAMRLPAWVAFLVSGLALLWVGCRAGLREAQLWVLALSLSGAPLVMLLAMVHTTDIWLFAMILVSLGAFAEVVHCDGRQGAEIWWVCMGFALGLGALAKLSIALIPLALFPWVVLRMPHILLTAGPYLGAAVCALIMSPWIAWNLDHDFAHFKHEFGHVARGAGDWTDVISWLPIMVFSVLPVGWLAVFGGLDWRKTRDRLHELGFALRVREAFQVASAVLVLFFVLKGLAGPILINWVLPLVPFLLLGFAARVRWGVSTQGVVTAVQWVLVLAVLFPYTLGWTMQRDAFQKIRGWDAAIQEAAALAGPTAVLSTDHYSVLAWALFYWPERADEGRWDDPTGQVIPESTRRLNHYDRWAVLAQPHERVIHLGASPPEALRARCGQLSFLGDVAVRMPDGAVRSTFGVWECLAFAPTPPWPAMDRH
ncbi:MAG: ArnT family glycosyltransferase [Litorivicinaceae bacterium]